MWCCAAFRPRTGVDQAKSPGNGLGHIPDFFYQIHEELNARSTNVTDVFHAYLLYM